MRVTIWLLPKWETLDPWSQLGDLEQMSGFGTREPSDHQKKLIDEAIYLRGLIIASYAQVEFLLADLISKLENRFAYRIESRIKGVRTIADMPGYEAYRPDLHRLSDELLLYEELRHFMAHGFMRADFDRAGNHRFELLRYTREGEGKYELMQSTTDVTRLRQAVQDIGSYLSEVIRLFERIYREQKLEPKAPGGAM